MFNDAPHEVDRCLQIEEDMEGLSGEFPGCLEHRSPFSVDLLFSSISEFLVTVLESVLHQNQYGTKNSSMPVGLSGLSSRMSRSATTRFRLTGERCEIGDMSLPWSQILFIRLVPPQPYGTYITLQVFERHGPEHRWRLGADAFQEIGWVVEQMRSRVSMGAKLEVPDALRSVMEGSASSDS